MQQSIADKGLLAIILLAIFVVPSSISGTAVALPAIGLDIHAPLTSLQWVVNAFNLTFACFTLSWGAVADNFGRKTCFSLGAVLYALASLLSALADSPMLLDLSRALAGIGAAAVFSCGIAILSTRFEGAARLRAFALFGTVAGLGVSLGPTLSGVILEHFSWRAIFWCHTLALLLVLLGSAIIPRDLPAIGQRLQFDTVGASLFILLLLALMTAIVQSSQWGWNSQGILLLLALAVATLALFIWQEKRHPNPMLDLSLLTNQRFVGMALVTVAASFGFVTLLTYLPSYLGGVLQLAPTRTGLTMLLLTLPMLICPLLAGKLVAHGVSANRVLNASLLSLLLGIILLAAFSNPSSTWWQLALPMLLLGCGMGLSAGLVDGMALKMVPAEKAGMAAGLLNTFRLGSEAVAVALYGSLLATLLGDAAHGALTTLSSNAEQIHGWINAAAAGNLAAPAPMALASQLQSILIKGYDQAFHGVLWLLAAIILLLTGLIAWLIRPAMPATEVSQPL